MDPHEDSIDNLIGLLNDNNNVQDYSSNNYSKAPLSTQTTIAPTTTDIASTNMTSENQPQLLTFSQEETKIASQQSSF